MSYKKLKENTPKGYNPYELMSAMQKFIRRSMEKEALFCFYEMEAHGLYYNIRNRLLITIYEDIGMANPDLVNSINGHISRMDHWHKAKNGAWRLIVGNIILMACRGSKSRIADQFVSSVAAEMVNGYRINLDDHDFVYDMHTRKGKKLGRGHDHFYSEGAKIIESEETTDYEQEEIEAFKVAKKNGRKVWEDYTKSDEELSMVQKTFF